MNTNMLLGQKIIAVDTITNRLQKIKIGKSLGLDTQTETIDPDSYHDSTMAAGVSYHRPDGYWKLHSIDTTTQTLSLLNKGNGQVREFKFSEIKYLNYSRENDPGYRVPLFWLGFGCLFGGVVELVTKDGSKPLGYKLVAVGLSTNIYIFGTGHWIERRKYKIKRIAY